jgi:exopolysaccharide production protein ExoZ
MIAGSGEAASRPPRRLSGIEASRGVAASLVVLYHVARHLDKGPGAPVLRGLFQFGHAGVDFFFVISGFIILFVHYNDVDVPGRLPHYAGRRFTRLMPTWWVALALTIGLNLAGTHGVPSFWELGRSMSLYPSNLGVILGVGWTLQFEILFYALFAILILSRKAGTIVLTAWFCLTILGYFASFYGVPDLNATGLPLQFWGAYNVEFFFGMAVAVLLRNRTVPHPRLILLAGLVLFGTSALLEDLHILNGYFDSARIAYGIPAALLVLGIAEADRQSPLNLPPLLRRIGAASYSIYLFQFIFIATVWQTMVFTGLDQRLPAIILFAALTLAAVGGGVLMSEWVEYPLMRLVRTHHGGLRFLRAGAGAIARAARR